mmetsp:Transcript_2076/g.6063  ORF Transcript_2076/g.6063 Transcript_2076/m.6063 type:complete len:217 (+) Transcript_2076:184-834(+)
MRTRTKGRGSPQAAASVGGGGVHRRTPATTRRPSLCRQRPTQPALYGNSSLAGSAPARRPPAPSGRSPPVGGAALRSLPWRGGERRGSDAGGGRHITVAAAATWSGGSAARAPATWARSCRERSTGPKARIARRRSAVATPVSSSKATTPGALGERRPPRAGLLRFRADGRCHTHHRRTLRRRRSLRGAPAPSSPSSSPASTAFARRGRRGGRSGS